MTLIHYIIARRDLPVGALVAQVTHAAGESFYDIARVAQEREHPVFNREVTCSSQVAGSTSFPGGGAPCRESGQVGSSPAPGAIFNPHETVAVVLGARNEGRLLKIERALVAAGVPHVAVRETDGEYSGQLMAIGLVPRPRRDSDPIRDMLADFHMLRECAPG